MNTYYDSTDLEDPFKTYYEVTSDLVFTDISITLSLILQPTTVILLNEEETIVWGSQLEIYLQENFGSVISALSFNVDTKIETVEQVTSYEISPSERRLLSNNSTDSSSNNDVKTANGVYYCFILMAQIGGFYSFIKLVLTMLTSKLVRVMMQIDLVNKVNRQLRQFSNASTKNDQKFNNEKTKNNRANQKMANILSKFGQRKPTQDQVEHEGGAAYYSNDILSNQIDDQTKRLKARAVCYYF